MKTILVLPDPHDEPGVSKERFRWLGKLIAERQPDAIVHMGDGSSFDSLSQYDIGTIQAEGQRYSEDLSSFHEAMEEMWAPVEALNRKLIRQKKAMYDPKKVYCLGNHEQRIVKAVQQEPRLEGTISLADLGLEKNGWEVHPLTDPANVYGIAFAHYFTSGIMGRPIFGVNHARSLVAKTYTSSVVGHSHDRSFWEDTDVYGRKVFGLVAGCYFDHDLSYTREEDRNWAGIVLLHVDKKHVDPEFISIQEMKRRYS
jgi:predicted phosphodiesterase